MNTTASGKTKLRDRLIEIRKRNFWKNKKVSLQRTTFQKDPNTSLPNFTKCGMQAIPSPKKTSSDLKIIFISKNKDKGITSLKELVVPENKQEKISQKKMNHLKKDKVVSIKTLPPKIIMKTKEIKNQSLRPLILKNKEVKQIVTLKKEENQKKELEGNILKRLSKKFKDNLNELEIMQSQLFFLNEKENESLEELNETIRKIKEILKRIEKLKKEYLKLKENYDFDDVIELEDKFIVEDILAYRTLVDNRKDDVVKVMKEYRKIEEYKLLYDELKYTEKETKKMKDSLTLKQENIIVRNTHYQEFKVRSDKLDKLSKVSNRYLNTQQEYLSKILQNVSKIETKKRTRYFFNGFSNYFSSGLEYLSLLMLKPFRGNTLSMAMSIASARKMVSDARSSIRLEAMTKLVYEAYDYKEELKRNLYDLEYMENNVHDVLQNIASLKAEFSQTFSFYKEEAKYKTIFDRIQKVEKVVLANQKYLDQLLEKNKEAERLNEEKLVKVKKLNISSVERRSA